MVVEFRCAAMVLKGVDVAGFEFGLKVSLFWSGRKLELGDQICHMGGRCGVG